jgi:hypothetical protein
MPWRSRLPGGFGSWSTVVVLMFLAGSPVRAAGVPPAPTQGWFPFDPKPDAFATNSAIDLRFLNERFAGEHGFISTRDGHFIHAGNGQPVRFWGVDGPPGNLQGEALRRCARMLAKHGVNLVRIHGGYFKANGDVDMGKVRHTIAIVEAMKAEGIYSHLSIYFPLWLTPGPGTPWLRGYNGHQHPFAALFFNPAFQAVYRRWWTALLTTPSPATGKRLVAEPALAGLEIQNEDSFFFWTFAEKNLPDAQWRILEKLFGDWLERRYGSLQAAFARWHGLRVNGDAPAEGRVAFRPLWNMFHDKTPRDQDTAQFLFETQRKFYADTYAFLRHLGFKGVITASNWTTASPEVFGPLERWSYTVTDFIDRHGYFSCNHKGPNAAWSIRDGDTYSDRSALRFDAEDPARPKQFVNPVMDPHYDDKPSMISETTFNRPNRFRSEAPLYYAVYGALQGSDAIVHFALDGAGWSVKPGYFMQPWTLMSPAMMGQFPAAALMFRRPLIRLGRVVARVELNQADLLHLQGTPLPQDAALDELRLAEVPDNGEWEPGRRLDPLLHYVGRADVRFVSTPGSVRVTDLRQFIDHRGQTVASSTGELRLDYGRGVLIVNAPGAQGVSGALKAAGVVATRDLVISSPLSLGHIIVVSLDGRPLSASGRMLLQVMSEEKASGFETEPVSAKVKRIVHIGMDPWEVRELRGTVTFKRADAARLQVAPLDFNGYPTGRSGTADRIDLRPRALYYLISD